MASRTALGLFRHSQRARTEIAVAAGGGEISLHRRAGVELCREGAARGKLGGREGLPGGWAEQGSPACGLVGRGRDEKGS